MSKQYNGEYLDRIAFPLGGIGAGMVCLEGTGALSHVSVRHQPDVFNEPCVFSAVCVKGEKNTARVLEGPVPRWKAFGGPSTGNGIGHRAYGLPRMADAVFSSRFPFARIELKDSALPLEVEITGWSPFVPGDPDSSSLPMAGLEYRFRNASAEPVEAVYSFNARNFMSTNSGKAEVLEAPNGFVLWEPGAEERPWDQGAFCASVDDDAAIVNHVWFRGGWFDGLTMAWNDVQDGNTIAKPPVTEGEASQGGSVFVPFTLKPGEEKTVRLMFSWYVPNTDMRYGAGREDESCCCEGECQPARYKPWYAGRFADIKDAAAYWRDNYADLRARSLHFSDCFFDSTLPAEVIEAVEANLAILKSPTMLRQSDGRLWCWEGCSDTQGCCTGSCTHVWNYAQAVPNLFPMLERTLRWTEFNESQSDDGHQQFRVPLPIRPAAHSSRAACDGQLGGIIKLYREWRLSGDTEWLRSLWPKAKQSLHYCIEMWDPKHEGVLEEPHHNTYDIEFWGPDGMCTSFYLGALRCAVKMGEAMGEDVSFYAELLDKGRHYLDYRLYDGEYYIQDIRWKGLRVGDPTDFKTLAGGAYSPEARAILEKEGPKYQYGNGCISDGVLGFWMAQVAGLDDVGNAERIKSHLASVHKYNLKHDLSAHANPQRPGFALGDEGGLLLCSWPKGSKLSLPFVYSDEVWTGIEYQAASHMMMNGLVEEGLDVVRTARERYDGKKRNPYDEYECGHWYARAMSSYALLQGLTGARYDAVDKVLYLKPSIKGDFRSFLSTETGYGTVGVKDGKPFIEVKHGKIDIERTEYVPAK